MLNINIYIIAISTFLFCCFRTRFLMLFFQQDEYRNFWFLKFIFKRAELIDKKLTFCLLLIWAISIEFPFVVWGIIPLFIYFSYSENDFIEKAKKKLVITTRIKRILTVDSTLIGLVVLFCTIIEMSQLLTALISIQLLPFLLIISNLILSPIEKRVQNKFKNEAIEKINKLKPTVIGITGSYGKTSTKHILAHILSGNLPVLWTPGSVNTEMGITRIIREKLTEEHKYFIAEMGAYFKGSIKKLCKLTNPQHGIITSIGQAHYEHFKTQETIASAKFELGEWVEKNKGILVVNSSQIEERFLPKDMPIIKVGKDSDNYITDILQTEDGLKFNFHTEGNSYEVLAPIYGEHQAMNIALSIEMALKLGMPISTILTTLKTLPQINHRLEVLQRDNGVKIIDDAYNSNIEGFKSGLNLLQVFPRKRRILITPGMVELGKMHDQQHYEIGKYAGERVDIAIIIRSDRIPTFVKGFSETALKETQLIQANSFKDAQQWMDNNLQSGDVVLLENDLTDIYESRRSL